MYRFVKDKIRKDKTNLIVIGIFVLDSFWEVSDLSARMNCCNE